MLPVIPKCMRSHLKPLFWPLYGPTQLLVDLIKNLPMYFGLVYFKVHEYLLSTCELTVVYRYGDTDIDDLDLDLDIDTKTCDIIRRNMG